MRARQLREGGGGGGGGGRVDLSTGDISTTVCRASLAIVF